MDFPSYSQWRLVAMLDLASQGPQRSNLTSLPIWKSTLCYALYEKCHAFLIKCTIVIILELIRCTTRKQYWAWRPVIVTKDKPMVKGQKRTILIVIFALGHFFYKVSNHAWRALTQTEKQQLCLFHGVAVDFVWLLCHVKEASPAQLEPVSLFVHNYSPLTVGISNPLYWQGHSWETENVCFAFYSECSPPPPPLTYLLNLSVKL